MRILQYLHIYNFDKLTKLKIKLQLKLEEVGTVVLIRRASDSMLK